MSLGNVYNLLSKTFWWWGKRSAVQVTTYEFSNENAIHGNGSHFSNPEWVMKTFMSECFDGNEKGVIFESKLNYDR